MNEGLDVYADIREIKERLSRMETAPRLSAFSLVGAGGLASSNVGISSLANLPANGVYSPLSSPALPTIVVPTGPSGRLLLLFGALVWITTGTSPSNNAQLVDLSPAVSGANTMVPGNVGQIAHVGYRVASSSIDVSVGSTVLMTGMNPGSNTVQLQAIRSGGATGSDAFISQPYLFGIPL